MPGVRDVTVSYQDQRATVRYDAATATVAAMQAALERHEYRSWVEDPGAAAPPAGRERP